MLSAAARKGGGELMDTSQNMLHVCSPHVSEDVGVETWIRVHVVVPGTSIFVHMHEHVWTRMDTRLQQGRGRRAEVFICKSGSSRAMRLRCVCNTRRGGLVARGRGAHG